MSNEIANLTALVKELRAKSGVGILACKKALVEANGDIEKAYDILRARGEQVAQNKADRAAHEGKVEFMTGENDVALVLVNCETDFVSSSEDFQVFAKAVAKVAYENQINDIEQLMAQPLNDGTVESARVALISKVGENVQVSNVYYHKQEGGYVAVYNHGAKIACAVFLNAKNEALARDIGMHVVAMNPVAISADNVPAKMIERERALFETQTEKMGKPEFAKKIIEGKMAKYLKEVCLLDQTFVKVEDAPMTVREHLKKSNAEVLHFIRVELS